MAILPLFLKGIFGGRHNKASAGIYLGRHPPWQNDQICSRDQDGLVPDSIAECACRGHDEPSGLSVRLRSSPRWSATIAISPCGQAHGRRRHQSVCDRQSSMCHPNWFLEYFAKTVLVLSPVPGTGGYEWNVAEQRQPFTSLNSLALSAEARPRLCVIFIQQRMEPPWRRGQTGRSRSCQAVEARVGCLPRVRWRVSLALMIMTLSSLDIW